MTVALAHERFDGMPGDENVALSHFKCGGTITVREILLAIAGKPGEYHVNVFSDDVDQPKIVVSGPYAKDPS